MTPSRVPDLVAGRALTGNVVTSSWCRVRVDRMPGWSQARSVISLAFAVFALGAALAAGTAQASLLSPSGSFGSQGSGNGQFQGPLGVAVQQSSGNVFVVDSQN